MGLARVITTIVKSLTGMFQMVDLHEFREVPVSEIKRLNVNTTSTDVQLYPSEQENIIIELKGQVSKRLEDAFKLDVNKTSSEALDVAISKRKSFVLFGFIIDRSKLHVAIPEKWYESLSVRTSSGSIEGEGLTTSTLNMSASSGDVRVNRAIAKSKISLEASSGDIHTDHLKSDGDIILQTSSGEIDASELESGSIRARANSGDIDVRNITANSVSLRTSSGEIDARDLFGDVTAEASSGDIDITNNDIKGQWDLKASSGDVSVKLVNPESLSVTFNGGSGDGKVKIKGMDYQIKTEHALVGKMGSGEHKLNVRTNSGSFRLS